ncbi:hypothetical protein BN132_381 [Cronobacter turicensis 564]|nr:hypothetical protein BN132_381 [Cronobacter turicensis 564]
MHCIIVPQTERRVPFCPGTQPDGKRLFSAHDRGHHSLRIKS